MSGMNPTLQDACGCCEGVSIQAPAAIDNRPGLSVIAYRIGTHSEFLASLEARLSSADYPVLAGLRTRDNNDFSIALLDAYACMADILTFYQERLANESYLRTAGERRSMSELARLIGYRLRPGVAAETWLAFTLQEPPPQAGSSEPKQASGVPASITLDQAQPVKVQSLPGPDEKPQIFETIESVELRPEWNVFLPKMSEMKRPADGDMIVYFQGTATHLKAGDALLFVGKHHEAAAGKEDFDFRFIQRVELDSQADRTMIVLDRKLGNPSSGVTQHAHHKVYAMRLRASLFGYNAPDWRAMSDAVKRSFLGIGASDAVTDTEWPDFTLADIADPPTGSGLYGEYFDARDLTDLKVTRVDAKIDFDWGNNPPDNTNNLIGADNFSVRWTGWIQAPTSGTYTFHTLSDDGVRLWVGGNMIINDWTDHAAKEDKSDVITLVGGAFYSIKLEYYEHTGAATIKLLWQPPQQAKQTIPQIRLYPGNGPIPSATKKNKLCLDALYPQIAPESWMVLATAEHQQLYEVETTAKDARANFTLSGKTSVLTVGGKHLHAYFNDQVRETTVFADSERIDLAETPIIADVAGGSLLVDRNADGLVPGRKIILSGITTAGDESSEVLTLLAIEPDGDASKLSFTPDLQYSYKRDSVKVYANVVRATHGDTVNPKKQVLGSGDGQQSHQRFELKLTPLTFIGADNEIGAASTLTVSVNDVDWHEVATLYDAGASDRSYVLRMGEGGQGTIQFGDGKRGARLPTGQDNVRATYRTGIGQAGNLKAGQLSQLLSRPLGVKAVSNPLPAEGGVDEDSADDARRNMPLGVRTLGRVVSLLDYEDYARAFSGIAKAQATVLNTSAGRTVFVTIAGNHGVSPPPSTLDNLLKAFKKYGDPFVHREVGPYSDVRFHLGLRIKCDPDCDSEKVKAAVEAALRGAFSFDARDFGQVVARSEVIAVAQEVDGVLGVDLDSFYVDPNATDKPWLAPPAATVSADGNPVAAGILLLDDGPLDSLELMS